MHRNQSGSSQAAVLAVLATVALSVVLFFVFTKPKVDEAAQAAGDGAPNTAADPQPAPEPAPAPEPTPEPQPEPPAFDATAEGLTDEIAKRIAAGDVAALKELFGDAVDEKGLAAVFGPGGYEPVPGATPEEVGLIGRATRWVLPLRKRPAAGRAETAAPTPLLDSVPDLEPEPPLIVPEIDASPELEPAPTPPLDSGLDPDPIGVEAREGVPLPPPPSDVDADPGVPGQVGEPGFSGEPGEAAGASTDADGSAAGGAPERLFFDLVRERAPDGSVRWKVSEVHFPPALQDLIDGGASGGPGGAEQDAMAAAHAFITAIRDRDFVVALAACAEGAVAEEKIAGLCIVFEDGQLEMRAQRPLVATALGPDKAWVIAHVESPKIGEASEFGLVMGRGEGGGWEITELNFGSLLDAFVAASEAGRVPYTPIKEQPGKGEMLVLYFQYDDEQLLPRAVRQLEILAGILKADAGKSITITGHADALGAEDYNARLSATRAVAVKDQLVAFGVTEGQIRTQGFGEAKPWKPNERPDGTDDPAGRAYNRRAELLLDFNGD